jgi:aldehyde:ferredoxin oxidoreductase
METGPKRGKPMKQNVFGFAGETLYVDLSKGKVVKKDTPKELMKRYLGGRGGNIKILYDRVGPNVKPLDPENPVIFGVGPLVGSTAPSCGRWNVSSRSPMTMILGDSNAGGHWAPELKWSGFDHLVFTGKSDEPVYLWINDGEAELRSAKNVWGKRVAETGDRIREEVREEEAKIATIGPAGENMVMGGSVMSDGTRAAGRTGIATVMGSKKLKAVAVLGTQGVRLANPDRFGELTREAHNEILEHPLYQTWQDLGTTFLLKAVNEAGRLATKNWSENVLPEEIAQKMSGQELLEEYVVKGKGCYNCPISCSRRYEVPAGPFAGTASEGPEYEAQVHLGSNLGVEDLEAVLHMNMLCNDLGLDVCTVGATIAWAMEIYEKGIITKEDTGGIELTWGNTEVAVEMVKKIARREGFGDVLADGSWLAAQKIGRGSEKYVIHSKRIPYTAVDPRGSFGWALAFSTSTRGADHLRSLVYVASLKSYQDQATRIFGVSPEATDEWSLEGKPFFVVLCEHIGALIDALGLCKTPSMILMTESYFVTDSAKPDKLAEIVSAATGFDLNGQKMLDIGERIYNVEKAFNAKFGFGGREHDSIPWRFREDVPPSEPRNTEEALVTEDKLDTLLDQYYELRGWDVETGLQKRAKLEELGLEDIADELEELDYLAE